MIKAFWLYTGPDGNSHVQRGSIADHALVETDSTFFKETPAYSSSDWHNDPLTQYVITIAGILEFATQRGESFYDPSGRYLANDGSLRFGSQMAAH